MKLDNLRESVSSLGGSSSRGSTWKRRVGRVLLWATLLVGLMGTVSAQTIEEDWEDGDTSGGGSSGSSGSGGSSGGGSVSTSSRSLGGSSSGVSSGGSGSRTPQNQNQGRTGAERAADALRGDLPSQNRDLNPRDALDREEAADRDLVNDDFATEGGNLFENPVNREISMALNTGEADTLNEGINQQTRARNARTALQGDQAVDQAQAAFQDGQRSVNQFGDDGSVQNFQASQDVGLQRESIQSQRFTEDGGQALETGGPSSFTASGQKLVQREKTQAEEDAEDVEVIDIDRRMALARAAADIQSRWPSTQEQIQLDRPEGTGTELIQPQPGRTRDRVSGPGRITRSPQAIRDRARIGTDLDLEFGQGFNNRLDQRNPPGLREVQDVGVTQAQAQRVGVTQAQAQRVGVNLRSFQRNRTGLQRINVGRPNFSRTGRPMIGGFDFEGSTGAVRGGGSARAGLVKGRTDRTFDIVSTIAVEARTGEQARFERDEDKFQRKESELGPFVRNKPVQAQNLEYENSSTGNARFF